MNKKAMVDEQAQRIWADIMRHPQEASYLERMLQQHEFFQAILPDFLNSFMLLTQGFSAGQTLFLCGNGGSMADCQHISGELMKSFLRERPLSDARKTDFAQVESGAMLAETLEMGLACIVLGLNHSLASAIQNDYADDAILYAQELYNLGKPGDMLLGISTSGNARNVLYAAATAKALGMKTVGMTGEDGGKLSQITDVTLKVPGVLHYLIQEKHIIVYHTLCLLLELRFFGHQ